MTRAEALAHLHAVATAEPPRVLFAKGTAAELNSNFLFISDALHVLAYPNDISQLAEHLWRVKGSSRSRFLRRTRRLTLDIDTEVEARVVAVYLGEEVR